MSALKKALSRLYIIVHSRGFNWTVQSAFVTANPINRLQFLSMTSLPNPSSSSRPQPATAARQSFRRLLPGLLAVSILCLVYATTLQRDINGSSHDYLLDTGEIQVALNLWGTVHYTGYPLYTILSALLTQAAVGLGVLPALAASATSLAWSLLALLFFYLILCHILQGNTILAGLTVLAVGLTETFWLHSVIAEVYSFSFLLVGLAIFLGLRLREQWEAGGWVALIFVLGTAVAHHRILLFLLPLVLLLVWSQPWRWFLRKPVRHSFYALLAFMTPFAAYLYLPLRAHQRVTWVYGQPGTWFGFWQQFTGSEVTGGLLRLPDSGAAWIQNLHFLAGHLTQQFPWLFLLVGLIGLLWLTRVDWQVGLAFLFGAAALPFFVLLFPKAVWVPAVLMPSLLCAAIGAAYLLHSLAQRLPALSFLGWAACLSLSIFLLAGNLSFVNELTHDPAGRAVIERLKSISDAAPSSGERPTVALPWGTDFFAAAFGLYVTQELSDLVLVDHRANFAAIMDGEGRILTPGLYLNYWPPAWWEARVGEAHYSAVTPELIAIQRDPLSTATAPLAANFDLGNGIRIRSATSTEVSAGKTALTIYWEAMQPIERDYSVAVHWLTQFPPQGPADIVAQADSIHPVQGWYPTSHWRVGELVRDEYALETTAVSHPAIIAIAMYYVDENGQFVNSAWFTLEP